MPEIPKNGPIFYSSENSSLFKNTNLRFVLTSRNGGTSLPPYDSLNIAYHVGDEKSRVTKNRQIIQDIFCKNKPLLWMEQTHSDEILQVQKGYYEGHYKDGFVGAADAMVCADRDVACMVMVADCNPVVVYDPKAQCFGLIHAGREGLKKHIVPKTIDKMTELYASKPQDMLVFVGASIRKCCYEISQSLAETFDSSYIIKNAAKYRLDLIALLKDQLKQSAISPKNIEILQTCSCCEERLFSYRREGITGRFALVVGVF